MDTSLPEVCSRRPNGTVAALHTACTSREVPGRVRKNNELAPTQHIILGVAQVARLDGVANPKLVATTHSACVSDCGFHGTVASNDPFSRLPARNIRVCGLTSHMSYMRMSSKAAAPRVVLHAVLLLCTFKGPPQLGERNLRRGHAWETATLARKCDVLSWVVSKDQSPDKNWARACGARSSLSRKTSSPDLRS